MREPEFLDFLNGSNWIRVWVPKRWIFKMLDRHAITKKEMRNLVRKNKELEDIENKIKNVRSLVERCLLKDWVKDESALTDT